MCRMYLKTRNCLLEMSLWVIPSAGRKESWELEIIDLRVEFYTLTGEHLSRMENTRFSRGHKQLIHLPCSCTSLYFLGFRISNCAD